MNNYDVNSPLNVSTYDHMIDILTAIKEGKEVQRRGKNEGDWILHDISELPKFVDYEYRIKPKSNKYKVALFKDGKDFWYPMLVVNDEVAERVETDDNAFVKWLTDWVEYEI